MSRKRQSCTGRKKARDVGSCSLSRHRKSGAKGNLPRWLREQSAQLLGIPRRQRLERMVSSVSEVFRRDAAKAGEQSTGKDR